MVVDLWTSGLRFKSIVGLCSKGSFIHFAHFSLLAARLDMTYHIERAVKLESSINLLNSLIRKFRYWLFHSHYIIKLIVSLFIFEKKIMFFFCPVVLLVLYMHFSLRDLKDWNKILSTLEFRKKSQKNAILNWPFSSVHSTKINSMQINIKD